VDVGATVVAHQQPAELMEPGEAALHDPALGAEAGTVRAAPSADHRRDAAGAQPSAVGVVVVAAVGEQAAGLLERVPHAAAQRRHRVQQREQLGDVVTVAAGQQAGERDAARFDDEVMLGARPPAVDRARARLGAPFLACT
jgi:hypothetical protein